MNDLNQEILAAAASQEKQHPKRTAVPPTAQGPVKRVKRAPVKKMRKAEADRGESRSPSVLSSGSGSSSAHSRTPSSRHRSPSSRRQSRSRSRSVQQGQDRHGHTSPNSRASAKPGPASRTSAKSHPTSHSSSRCDRTKPTRMPPPVVPDQLKFPAPAPSPVPRDSKYVKEVNELFTTVMHRKSNSAAPDDCVSRSTGKSTLRRPPVRATPKPIDVEELLDRLPPNLREKRVSRATVLAIATCSHASKVSPSTRKLLIAEAISYITYTPVDGSQVDVPPPHYATARKYPSIDTTGYLLSRGVSGRLGFDRSCIHSRDPTTLVAALSTLPVETNKQSLDIVFRKAMKDVVRDFLEYDADDCVMTANNAILLSATSCELSLLKYIRRFYLQNYNVDVVDELTAVWRPTSLVTALISGAKCEKYLQKLCRFYTAHKNVVFEDLLQEPIGTPSQMRIWTDRETQTDTNIRLMDYLDDLHDEMTRKSGQSRTTEKEFIRRFTSEYNKRLEYCVESHRSFIADALRASELMSWLCFGITADGHEGTRNMAYSFCTTKGVDFERAKDDVCWNYPLASRYRRGRPVVVERPIVSDEEFWSLVPDDCSAPPYEEDSVTGQSPSLGHLLPQQASGSGVVRCDAATTPLPASTYNTKIGAIHRGGGATM